MLRNHLIPFSTPNPTPQSKKVWPRNAEGGRSGKESEGGEDEEPDDSSVVSHDSSDSEELATPS